MNNGINVLSLFDGISCCRLALNKAGVPVNQYFASEIDKNAIKITQNNFPDTIQLGNVCDIEIDSLPEIDLITGGFPCQSFSLAGKQLNFDDPRGQLFFQLLRIFNDCKKRNLKIKFLFENVKMKQQSQDYISDLLGIQPVLINSRLFVAQNRPRLYWTNIPVPELPNESIVTIKDILESNVGVEFDISEKRRLLIEKGNFKQTDRVFDINQKSSTLCAGMGLGGGVVPKISVDGRIRYLTPLETERLQGLPDNYTNYVAKTHRYKGIGNGWTVNVIAHIFSSLV